MSYVQKLLPMFAVMTALPCLGATDDPSVEELWQQWRNGSSEAYNRLIELGPEARELAPRIIKPEGEVFAVWPSPDEADLLASMQADAVPSILRERALEHSDNFIQHIEDLGRFGRPASDTLLEVAISSDGERREAALQALACTGTKEAFLIAEAVRILSPASLMKSDARSSFGVRLLEHATHPLAQDVLICTVRYHPNTAIRWYAADLLSQKAPADPHLVWTWIGCLDDTGGTGGGMGGSSVARVALSALAEYDELPAGTAVDLIEELYRTSFEGGDGYHALQLADAICLCSTTDPDATQLVSRKLRPLLEPGAFLRTGSPEWLKVAVAAVVLHWDPNDEQMVTFLSAKASEESERSFVAPLGSTVPDARAFAARSLGRLGPDAKEQVPMLRDVMRRASTKKGQFELRSSAAWALAKIDRSDLECVPVLRNSDVLTWAKWPEIKDVLGQRTEQLVDETEALQSARDPQLLGRSVRPDDYKGDEWEWRVLEPHADVALPVLLEHLNDESPAIRIESARRFGEWQFRPETLVPAVTELLNDRYASVRAAVAESLGQFGEAASAAVPKLEQLRGDDYLTVRLAAEDAIARIHRGAVPYRPKP